MEKKRKKRIEMISALSEKLKISKIDAKEAINFIFHHISESLVEGEKVFIRNFGSFVVKKKKEKIGRDISRGIAIKIPERHVPAFVPSSKLAADIKENFKPE